MQDTYSDEFLMEQVQNGALSQGGLLFERYHVPLYGFFVNTTQDRETSEDLVQDVFFRLIRYRTSYRSDHAFRPWLYQIARNVLYDHRKKQRPEESPDVSTFIDGGQDLVEQAETNANLHEALDRLPADQRELLVLSHVTDLSYREIAQLYGLEINTVRVRIFRALRSLRSDFLRHNPTDR